MIKKIIGVLLLIVTIASVASLAEPPNSINEFIKDFFGCLILIGITGGIAGLITLAICLILGDL